MEEEVEQGDDGGGGGKRWWQWVLLYPSIFVALVGAVPQYVNVFKGMSIGVSADRVAEAEEQNSLWQRNADCELDLSDVKTPEDVIISVGACPTGDVQVNVKYANGNSLVRWIAFEKLHGADRVVSRLGFSAAVASERPRAPLMLAQSGGQVICQRWLGEGRLLRRVRRGDKCFDEIINTFTGEVVERKAAKCDPSCE